MEFRGFLNDLQDWDLFKDKARKSSGQPQESKKSGSLQRSEEKGPPTKIAAVDTNNKNTPVSMTSSRNNGERYRYSRHADASSSLPSSFLAEDKPPDATSEKELGNEYFKQKNFNEAIDCYSRSIALSPSSVAFANRAMAYLKVKRFEEAENDCTEALNLDDRYVKAYSRRATARKELGRLRASMEDSEFAMRLEPNNQELRKQYMEAKALYEKELAKKTTGISINSSQGVQAVGKQSPVVRDAQVASSASVRTQGMGTDLSQNGNLGTNSTKDSPVIAIKELGSKTTSNGAKTSAQIVSGSYGSASLSRNILKQVANHKHQNKESIQDLASHAASRLMSSAAKNICAPKSAYQFEVSWRALLDDPTQQAQLLKTIPPATLPQVFKNALSAPILIDIIRCTATFFKDDPNLVVSILDNLSKVPRFNMIVMCLPAVDRADLSYIWNEVFTSKDVPAEHRDALSNLRAKYCYGEQQAHTLDSNARPKDV